ncbi:MAG: hypothetical protein QM496_08685 [Verrucomicrobiota bacterium]
MNIRQKLMIGLGVLAVSVGTSRAELQLLGPGVSTTMPSSALPDANKNTTDRYTKTVNLGGVYRFSLIGVEALADADGVPGWYTWGGHMQTFSEAYASERGFGVFQCSEVGKWNFKGKANDGSGWVNGGSIYFATSAVGYQGAVQTSLRGTPKVFENKNVKLKWIIDSNSRDIDGYMKILGTLIKDKPEPTGELLTGQIVYQEGAQPVISWVIDRGEQ